jgi:hypothetical protein
VPCRATITRISLLAVALAWPLALCGCANVDFENKDAWFSKPFEFVSRNNGYTFTELQESKDRTRPITANDLVDASGGCLAPPVAAPAPQPASAGPADNAAAAPPAAADDGLLGRVVSLGMSECDVVFRAGAPSNVQIGNGPNGGRSVVLTFNGGPRPGIYHFEAGALMEIDRVQVAPAPPQTAKKKPAAPKSSKQAAKE